MSPIINKFSGVHSALVTPFDAQGNVDLNALNDLIALQKVAGIHGLVMAGSTGEGSTLTVKERVQLVQVAKESGMLVTAGAGSNSTHHAIELQKAMEDAGADATLQVVPYYNKPTQRGLYEHFSAIAKIAKIPIILYNAAGRTCIDMAPETVAVIAKEHGNVIGIKDANTNVERLTDLMHLCKSIRPEFLVLAGEDAAFLPYLALGGDGNISVLSQVAGFEMLAMYNAFKNGDLVYAQKISRTLNGLCKLIFSHPNPIPIKTLLAALGVVKKSWRLPLCGLSAHEEEQLLTQCRSYTFVKNFRARGFLP